MSDEIPQFPTMRHQGNKPNADKRQTVVALYQHGHTIRDIARAVGVTFQAVHALLVKAGVPRRPRGGNTRSHSRHRA